MNVHREGSGAPLMLIHGIGHRWQAWSSVLPLLRDAFDVIAVDSPGFGESAPLPPDASLDVVSYARTFASWLSEMGLDRPHVAGNSMGGAIGLELARLGVVRSVTAISPVGFWSPGERRFCQVSLAPLVRMPGPVRRGVSGLTGSAVVRTLLGAQLTARPWRLPAADLAAALAKPPAFAGALAAFDDYDFARGAELDGVPVTVAWGSRDRVLLFGRQSQRARERLPGARHVTLRGLGHVPMTDDPGVVAHAIRAGAGA